MEQEDYDPEDELIGAYDVDDLDPGEDNYIKGPEPCKDSISLVSTTSRMREVINAAEELPEGTSLVSKFRMNITPRDLLSLNKDEWLNDNVVEFYLKMVMDSRVSQELVWAMATPKLSAFGYLKIKCIEKNQYFRI